MRPTAAVHYQTTASTGNADVRPSPAVGRCRVARFISIHDGRVGGSSQGPRHQPHAGRARPTDLHIRIFAGTGARNDDDAWKKIVVGWPGGVARPGMARCGYAVYVLITASRRRGAVADGAAQFNIDHV